MDHIENQSTKKKRRGNEDYWISSEQVENNEFDQTNEKRIHKKHIPKFHLKIPSELDLSTPHINRVPLILKDIQHLLLHSLLGNFYSNQSHWYVLDKCSHISQTTALILEGISFKHLEKYNQNMTKMKNIFSDYIEIVKPASNYSSLVEDITLVSLSETVQETLTQEYGTINLTLQASKDLKEMMKNINDNATRTLDDCNGDEFPRTQLLLSAWQLIEENYPVPFKGKLQHVYSDYVVTKDKYNPVTNMSPMFGLDCEMCQTNAGLELTRVSVVNEKHDIVYESLVKPYNNITDYLTRYSGITKSLLNNVTKRLEDVQKDLRELLPSDAILVGQSLNNDLHALKMMHPYVIDTSVVFNVVGARTRKSKLKDLAREFLNVDIQSGKQGHCSAEDSIASIKLVQLKLRNSVEFGDAVHTKSQYRDNIIKQAESTQHVLTIFDYILEQKKTSVVIGPHRIMCDYGKYLTKVKEIHAIKLKEMKIKKKNKLIAIDNDNDIIARLAGSIINYNLAIGHLKLEVNNENESKQMLMIDQWIQTIWKTVPLCALCVIVFGGTRSDNGVAMVKVKRHL